MDLVSSAVWVLLLRLIWFFLQIGVLKLNFLVRSSYLSFTRASLLDCLCMLLFVCDRIPGVRSVLLRVSRFCGSSARQVTLWSYPFIPSFYALVTILKHCMIRMWLTCGYWEVVNEVEPIALFIIKPLGVTSTLCLYCYAMLVDVVWVSESMTDVRWLFNGLLKLAT